MEYLKLGEIFKININNKMIYLKVEPDNSKYLCEECYFELNGGCIEGTVSCSRGNREDNINIIFKEINPILNIYAIFSQRRDGVVKQCGAYPNEEDAKKKVEELNKYCFDYANYYAPLQYYPYGIINDIKEIKL